MKQEDLKYYLTAKDIEIIAIQSGVTVQTIRAIIRCSIMKSAAMSLCFEVAALRKLEMNKKAKEIIAISN